MSSGSGLVPLKAHQPYQHTKLSSDSGSIVSIGTTTNQKQLVSGSVTFTVFPRHLHNWSWRTRYPFAVSVNVPCDNKGPSSEQRLDKLAAFLTERSVGMRLDVNDEHVYTVCAPFADFVEPEEHTPVLGRAGALSGGHIIYWVPWLCKLTFSDDVFEAPEPSSNPPSNLTSNSTSNPPRNLSRNLPSNRLRSVTSLASSPGDT